MPADLSSAHAILDGLTGSRHATLAMLRDVRWPGADLAAPEFSSAAVSVGIAQAGARPIRIAQAGGGPIRIAQGPATPTIPMPGGTGTTITIGDVIVERLPGGALRI